MNLKGKENITVDKFCYLESETKTKVGTDSCYSLIWLHNTYMGSLTNVSSDIFTRINFIGIQEDRLK